ncbi:nucleotide sugar dehydrogenase [Xanthomonas campestris pv. campestris]|uniref:Polysaccharide biosynthetic protein n=2 Tax=Xanthomonas campestris pv. campestris TaxID=340 RepID=Q8P8Y8_XANCP|nr:nucleotide sugar dehydrogenase [Xanthomonas campestris]AAM41379.1 polysaccharide biosynthetic protein [Xanthomonas campestris pv. campestris str. ATCC 33913]AAY49147.1 polysaccharide biosynthetic protein [Xanthomonas campestris pv. campestris str. 8004]AKS16234.1 UDP-N-acetyl-D-galactosamine dehydrogenase [Xanthomonas campestris pv. campestris]AKS20254.1 UDP-N-acetyl-D-galactosamine dehydrogenase [Xanthomonas campestris pv. campestris]ALE68839.1 UDP-N-acetyl-D-galactosamine dehydrogenase [X
MSRTPPFDPLQAHIAVIGLGYVGLPLAVAFGERRDTLGFDIDAQRVAQLQQGHDATLELDDAELAAAGQLRYTADAAELAGCTIFIVTVPTPIDSFEQPDLEPLRSATVLIAAALKPGDLVIYESTVYPGTTEEVCVPLLEEASGLRFNADFFCGYSPERVNPGDRQRRLRDIRKITSGSTPAAADAVDALYASIITAGTWRAGSIRVAEAAKVVENIQRDVNIALVNELALIFDKLGIDTLDVLEAAGTKWNFLPFRPGLVGGHCIGVDPYYLLHKSESVGYHPDLIHTARQVNNRVGRHVAERVCSLLAAQGIAPPQARVLVLGATFKENCPDLRNSRALELVQLLQAAGAQVDTCDPWADPEDALRHGGVQLCEMPEEGAYDAVVLAVAHAQYRDYDAQRIAALGKPGAVFYDVKSVWPRASVNARL